MKTNKIAVIFIAMILCIAQAAFSTEKPKQQVSGPVSGTRQASCVIRIIADRQVLSPEGVGENILSILQSSSIGVKAAKDILGYEAEIPNFDNMDEVIDFGFEQKQDGTGNDWIYTFGLKIDLVGFGDSNPRPAAREFMQSLIDGLKKNLDKSFMDYKERLTQQMQKAQEDAANAEHEFYRLQEQLRGLSGPRDLSRKAILADINSLQTRIENLQMDVVDNEFYLKDFPKQIESLRQNTEQKIKQDEISRELSGMVAEAKKQMDSVQKLVENGTASAQEFANAREKLSKARIELAQRLEELQKSSGGTHIERLNEELAGRLSDKGRSEELMRILHTRFAEAEELLKKTDDYEVLSIKADIAKKSLRQALERLDSLKQSANIMPPTITIMGN